MEANNKTGIDWIQQHTISILIGFVVLLFLITGFQYYQISGQASQIAELQGSQDKDNETLSIFEISQKLESIEKRLDTALTLHNTFKKSVVEDLRKHYHADPSELMQNHNWFYHQY